MTTLYLNNDGSRWIHGVYERGKFVRTMKFVLVLPDGTRKVRQADFYESFGNFALTCYRYRGKRYAALPRAHDGSENRLPHVWHVE